MKINHSALWIIAMTLTGLAPVAYGAVGQVLDLDIALWEGGQFVEKGYCAYPSTKVILRLGGTDTPIYLRSGWCFGANFSNVEFRPDAESSAKWGEYGDLQNTDLLTSSSVRVFTWGDPWMSTIWALSPPPSPSVFPTQQRYTTDSFGPFGDNVSEGGMYGWTKIEPVSGTWQRGIYYYGFASVGAVQGGTKAVVVVGSSFMLEDAPPPPPPPVYQGPISTRVYALAPAPRGMTFDTTGNLFVANGSPGTPNPATPVTRIGPGGTPVVPLTAYNVFHYTNDFVRDVAIDNSGSLTGHAGELLIGILVEIGVIDASGQFSSLIHVPYTFHDMEFDHQGRLMVLVNDGPNEGRALYAITRQGGTIQGATTISWLNLPGYARNIAIAPDDRIMISSTDGVISEWSRDGALINGSFATGFAQSNGSATPMAFGPGGGWGDDLYAIGNGNLVRLYDDGYSTIMTDLSSYSSFFTGMQFGSDGVLYLSDAQNERILAIAIPEPGSLALLTFAGISVLGQVIRRRMRAA
jgi:hypothetical protein